MGTDITYLFRELSRSKKEELLEHGIRIPTPPVEENESHKHEPDRLTQECLQIGSKIKELAKYLAKIRPMYLSNSRFSSHNDTLTDKQRDDIDYETRLIVQQQMGRLRALEELEKKRLEKLSQGSSAFTKFLRDPKKDGIEKTIELHRAGMFWFLNDLLKSVSDMHAAQQEIRLSRQLEKSKSTFHNISQMSGRVDRMGGRSNSYTSSIGVPEESNDLHSTTSSSGIEELSAQQIQQLEQENDSLLEELELTHDKVKQAEKSMYEIAELQTSLAAHLSSQNDKIQSLLDDAFKTSSDVSAANEQLASARKRNRRASKMIIYSSITLGFVLLFYDSVLG